MPGAEVLSNETPLVGELEPDELQWTRDHVQILSLKMSHHASASGYDRIADYLQCPSVDPFVRSAAVRQQIAKLLARMIQQSGSLWYNRASAMLELDGAIASLRDRKKIYHYLYGENCYRYLSRARSFLPSKGALIATYHTPPERFTEVITKRRHVSRLDGAILMSNAQRPAFQGLLPAERLHFIPHGVDTEYFRPADVRHSNKGTEKVRFFCAGRMLRDYPTLVEAAAILQALKAPIEIVILATRETGQLFAEQDNVELYSGVCDVQLLELYQGCDALVMPLTDCTANNVLLEGLACGLGVVATDLQGVRDYTTDSCCELVEARNAEALASAMLLLANDSERLEQMGRAARQQALELSWPNIARRHISLYRQLGTAG